MKFVSDVEMLRCSVVGSEDSNNNEMDVLDVTNMFHWCTAPSFDSVILVCCSIRYCV